MGGQGVVWLAVVGFGVVLLALAAWAPMLAGMWLVAGSWLMVLCFTQEGKREGDDGDTGR
jgi:fatty acid desaturase